MARRSDGELHVVLLAGGSGTRFWPLSRSRRPKQLLALVGRETLLARTWNRVRRLVPASRIWVVTPAALAAKVRRELPQLAQGRLILEPSPRDTAPAVALACATLARRIPDAVVGVFPTDHVIGDGAAFVRSVKRAATAAADGALVCLGIEPQYPGSAAGGFRQTEQHQERRGFSGTVGAQESEDFTFVDRKRQMIYGDLTMINLG